MASSTPLCSICDFQHVSKPAVDWCSQCDERLCTECSNHHRSAKSSRNHATTQIDEYQKLPAYILDIEQSCKEHGERFTLFCREHDTPYCRICGLQKHKKCQDISKIEDIVQNVKTSHAFQETEQILTELAENIHKILKDREENLELLETSKLKVEKEIKEFRVKVNEHLDKLQEGILQELTNVRENEKLNMQKIVIDLQQKKKEIDEIQVNIPNIKQYASDLQTYLAMKQIQNDMDKSDAVIDSLISTDKLQRKVLSLEINSAMKDILSNVKNFGKIMVEIKGCNVIPTKKKNQQAQLLVPQGSRSIDDIKLQLKQTFNINSHDGIRGCCILPDGRFVFTSFSYPGKLIIMNADGTENTTLTTLPYPFDVIYVKFNDSLAVMCGLLSKRCITFIDIKNSKVRETTQLDSDGYGLAEKNNTLFYCGQNRINSLNLTDKTITRFTDIKPVLCSYIDIFENNLYHTDKDSNTVTCYDIISRQVKWQFQDESVIKYPYGISVDNRGNVYVASYTTSNVVVISPDGQKFRELLSTKDNLCQPIAIHYDRSTDNLLVTNEQQTGFLYKVT